MTRSAPACDRRRDRLDRPVAAADLEREAAGRRDALDEVERRRAAERAVEVDEVEPAGPLVAEAPGELDRVAALDRHRLAPALRQAHDAALEDVDGGDDVEGLVLILC